MKRKVMIAIGLLAVIGVLSNLTDSIVKEESIKEFFFYFTVQSNIFVAVLFLYVGFTGKETKWVSRFYGGVFLYIMMTFLVFVVMLQPIFHPDGFGFVANVLNHYVTPLCVLLFTSILPMDGAFEHGKIKYWFIYPVTYIILLVLYGSITGNYLYPFLQVSEVGITGLLIAIGSITVLFYLGAILIVKILSNEKKTRN